MTIYSHIDVQSSIEQLSYGLRNVVVAGKRARPTGYILSYFQHSSGFVRKVMGDLGKAKLTPIQTHHDLQRTIEGVRAIALSAHRRGASTEAVLLAVEGPTCLLPFGEEMGDSVMCAAIYAAHIHQRPQVVYAPLLQHSGLVPTLGEFSEVQHAPIGGFPDILPIELYGQSTGEA